MNDTLITIVGIFLAAILMFVFPLMTIADRNDDVAKQAVSQKTIEFVDKSRNVGAITQADLQEYKEKIGALGHTFKTDMEVKRIDENVGKKTSWTTSQVVGENTYYSVYTEAIEAQVNGPSGKFTLKEGDIFSVSVKNTNKTLSQTIRSVFYSISGSDIYSIAAQHSGVVTANGSY